MHRLLYVESSALLGTGNTVNVSVIAATIGGEPSRWSKAYTQGSCEKQSWENTERLHRLSGNSECGCSSTEGVAGGREDAGRALGVTERSLHLVQRAVEAPGLWGVSVCVQMWGRAYTYRLPRARPSHNPSVGLTQLITCSMTQRLQGSKQSAPDPPASRMSASPSMPRQASVGRGNPRLSLPPLSVLMTTPDDLSSSPHRTMHAMVWSLCPLSPALQL